MLSSRKTIQSTGRFENIKVSSKMQWIFTCLVFCCDKILLRVSHSCSTFNISLDREDSTSWYLENLQENAFTNIISTFIKGDEKTTDLGAHQITKVRLRGYCCEFQIFVNLQDGHCTEVSIFSIKNESICTAGSTLNDQDIRRRLIFWGSLPLQI